MNDEYDVESWEPLPSEEYWEEVENMADTVTIQ